MNRRIVSQAVVIVTGIPITGHGEIPGVMVGDSESKPFGTKSLRSLRARGLGNVQLVASDSLSGLAAAIRSASVGSAWLRCRVHSVCHVCRAIERASRELVTETTRTVFAQTTGEDVRTRLNVVANGIERQFPQIKRLFLEAATDITAFAD